MRTHGTMRLILLATCVAGGSLPASSVWAQQASILETGSSLLYPLFNLWVPAYTKDHKIHITTQSTGSGTGISQAVSGLAQIGASDAYLSPALKRQHQDMLNIPMAVSSQMINYNLPGVAPSGHLRLSGPVLAAIYQGKITSWDDPQIGKMNPGVALPHKTIVPIHRTDGSGDTFIFTQFLSDSTPEWKSSIGYGTTASWPTVQEGLGAEGNQGMVNALQQNPYSIAYVGISYKDVVEQNKLGVAELENKAGKFVMPDDRTVKAAAEVTGSQTPADESISLILQPGDESYPIINYEYAVVNSRMPEPQAKEVRDFLNWALKTDGGSASSYMAKVNFIALPSTIQKLSQSQIDRIGRH